MSEMERQEIRPRLERASEHATNDLNSTEVLASDAERERVSTLLQEACVDGRLTLEEFAQRMEQTQAARTRGQLDEITRDLPTESVPATTRQNPVSLTVAIMSEDKRQGYWCIGEESKAIAIMGSCKLDLRNAAIASHVTTIEAYAIMGSIEVVVPEGVEVELNVIAVMGAKKLTLAASRPSPGAPLIRIDGFVLMGEVTVRDQPPFGQWLREQLTGKRGQ